MELSGVGERERFTQNRVVKLFRDKLKYIYLGNLHDQENSNIDEKRLKEYLSSQGYSEELIRRAINSLVDATKKPDLYDANKEVYSLLRYGASVRENVSEHNQTVKFINWEEPHKNNFYIAEEVTVKGEHIKRPDIVLYINGDARGTIAVEYIGVARR